MYTVVGTQHHLPYVIAVTNHKSNPRRNGKQSSRYIYDTMGIKLTHSTNQMDILEVYTVLDYTINLVNGKSTSCYIFMHASGVISWRSKLQDCTTLSMIEAEYIAASKAAKETIWLQ